MSKKFYFKHEYWGDDWQEHSGEPLWREETVAMAVAEKYWRKDPCDPYCFVFRVEVKCGEDGTPKKFIVTAETDVNFYATLDN